jgi:hypothetical protein
MRYKAIGLLVLAAGSWLVLGACDTLKGRKLTPEERILGVGQQRRSGSTARPQGGRGGRQGTLVMIRANGKATFRLTTTGGQPPTSATVTRFVVTGFDQTGCRGRAVCSQNALLANPVPFRRPTRNRSGTSFFDPGGSDNGILEGLLRRCGCSTRGVGSVQIEVQVRVDPQPVPPSDLTFVFCEECTVATD